MTKTEVKEILRESIRNARIQRDAGDDMQHDRVIKLTHLLNQVNALTKDEVNQFAERYNINKD